MNLFNNFRSIFVWLIKEPFTLRGIMTNFLQIMLMWEKYSIKLGCIAFPNAGYPHFSESSAYIVDPFTTCLYLDLMNILMIAFSHVGVPLLPNWFVMQQSPGWGLPFLEYCLTYFNPVWSVFRYFSSKWCSYLLLCTAINPFSTELLFQWRFKIIVMWYLNIRNVQNAELVIYF